MCAIIDNNVRDELVKQNPSAIGKHFRDVVSGKERKLNLVVGGKLLKELSGSEQVRHWIIDGIRSGYVVRIDDSTVNRVAKEIAADCRSDDPHVIALAKVSGARLLFTRDHQLMQDFLDRKLLGGRIPGRVYTDASGRTTLRRQHRELLKRALICAKPQWSDNQNWIGPLGAAYRVRAHQLVSRGLHVLRHCAATDPRPSPLFGFR